MNIQTKIIIGILGIILFIGGIAAFVNRTVSRNIEKNEISDHLLTTAQSRSHNIETTQESQREKIEMFATEAGIYLEIMSVGSLGGSASESADQDLLQGMVYSSEQVRGAIIVDKNGMIANSSSREYEEFDMSSSHIFHKRKTRSSIIAFIQDISERVKMQDTLNTSLEEQSMHHSVLPVSKHTY